MSAAQPAQAPTRLGFRPALTGVRALGVVLVMVFHLGSGSPLPGGHIGVDVFFVLSGFLITAILVEEWRSRGEIGLLNFYMRRALRLMPALLALLVVFAGWAILFQDGSARFYSLRASGMVLVYSSNVFQGYTGLTFAPQLQHAWSLGMEEQFYLVWPVALLLMLRLRWSVRTLCGVILAGVLLLWAARVILIEASMISTPENLFYAPPFRADALLVGCLLGLAFGFSRGPAWLRAPGVTRRAGWLGLLLLLGYSMIGSSAVAYLEWGLVIAVASAALIWWLVLDETSTVARFFSLPPIVGVGKISYALYLWHVPILYAFRGMGLRGAILVVAYSAASVAAATASYFLVERPALKLKTRFARVERDVAGRV